MSDSKITQLRAAAEAMTKPGEWKCWNGYGPSASDGRMRMTRIGPAVDGGIYGPEAASLRQGADLAADIGDAEGVCIAVNHFAALVDIAEVAMALCILNDHGVAEPLETLALLRLHLAALESAGEP